ncbi:unnamed protein product [Pleuronectes platessa]|uniref:Secreted protein n=1 Tax=Pleuronectes platessa TaxID=8262 RepID=A0A9N7VZM1_PLEPL|nr:unnamed protein product [Pleuronectes platessa]
MHLDSFTASLLLCLIAPLFASKETQSSAWASCFASGEALPSAISLLLCTGRHLAFAIVEGSPTHDLIIPFDNSVLAPTQTARNMGKAAQVLVQALAISRLDH